MVLVSGFQASAASLCHEVLRPVFAPEKITVTIENIARLKIEADLEKSAGAPAGQNSLELSKTIFNKKYSELLHALKGIKSETEIRFLISQKISELQKQNIEKDKVEKERREVEIKIATQPSFYERKFRRSKRIPVDFVPEGSSFEYVPKLNALLMVSREATSQTNGWLESIRLFDLKTLKSTYLVRATQEKLKFVLSSSTSGDGRYFTAIVRIDSQPQIFIFDIEAATQKFIPIDNSLTEKEIINLQMNPSGTQVLLIGRNSNKVPEAVLIDVQTGVSTKRNDITDSLKIPDLVSYPFRNFVSFISDHELVFLNKIPGTDLKIYDLSTQQTKLVLQRKYAEEILVTRDLRNVIVRHSINGSTAMATIPVDQVRSGAADANEFTFLPDLANTVVSLRSLPKNGFFVPQWTQFDANSAKYHYDIVDIDPALGAVPATSLSSRKYTMNVHLSHLAVDITKQRLFAFPFDQKAAYIDVWVPEKSAKTKP
jgi:hypothetical protein